MPCPIALSNAIVMNKYIWMCRNLRNFNDVGSIINWVNTMASVKTLLLDPPPASLFPAVPQQSSLHPSHHQFLSTSNQQRPHHDLSISRPTTATFLPIKRKPLTVPFKVFHLWTQYSLTLINLHSMRTQHQPNWLPSSMSQEKKYCDPTLRRLPRFYYTSTLHLKDPSQKDNKRRADSTYTLASPGLV